MVVYLEVVLLDNALFDLCLLQTTALFFFPRPKWWRMALAVALGTAYATIALLRGFVFLQGPLYKLLISAAMVVLCFGGRCWRALGKRLLVFWLCGVGWGGVLLGLGAVFEVATVRGGTLALTGLPLWAVLLGGLAMTYAVRHAVMMLKRHQAHADHHVTLTILANDRETTLDAFWTAGASCLIL